MGVSKVHQRPSHVETLGGVVRRWLDILSLGGTLFMAGIGLSYTVAVNWPWWVLMLAVLIVLWVVARLWSLWEYEFIYGPLRGEDD